MNTSELLNVETWRQWSRHPMVPNIVAALFFLFALLTALQLWDYFSLRPKLSLATHTVPAAQRPVELAALHLFGSYDATYANLPVTNLALVLQGTVVVPASEQSIAIIMVNKQMSQVFTVGQTVLGADIIKIFLDRVVLKYDGTLQSLPLPIQKLPGINTPSFDALADKQE